MPAKKIKAKPANTSAKRSIKKQIPAAHIAYARPVVNKLSLGDDILIKETKTKMVQFKVSDILLVETRGNYVNLYWAKLNTLMKNVWHHSLVYMNAALPAPPFFSLGRNYILQKSRFTAFSFGKEKTIEFDHIHTIKLVKRIAKRSINAFYRFSKIN